MTTIAWFGLGWAVFLGLWFLLWVLGYHEKPTPTQPLSEQERKEVLIFHAIKSPTLSDPAKKGFVKNFQRHT